MIRLRRLRDNPPSLIIAKAVLRDAISADQEATPVVARIAVEQPFQDQAVEVIRVPTERHGEGTQFGAIRKGQALGLEDICSQEDLASQAGPSSRTAEPKGQQLSNQGIHVGEAARKNIQVVIGNGETLAGLAEFVIDTIQCFCDALEFPIDQLEPLAGLSQVLDQRSWSSGRRRCSRTPFARSSRNRTPTSKPRQTFCSNLESAFEIVFSPGLPVQGSSCLASCSRAGSDPDTMAGLSFLDLAVREDCRCVAGHQTTATFRSRGRPRRAGSLAQAPGGVPESAGGS